MIKLFVSDIDGTMLQDEGIIDHEDIQALHTLADTGVTLCFASGRLDNEIADLMKDVQTDFHRISVNGGFIYTPKNEQLFSATFESDILQDLMKLTASEHFIRYVSDEHHYYIEEKTPFVLELEKRVTMTSIEIPNLQKEIGVSIHPNKFAIGGLDEDLLILQKQIEEAFPSQVTTFISAKNCLDIVPINVNKGAAITLLLQQHGVAAHEMACVGDSYNDLPMFALTPHSFAMNIADDAVKQGASHVVSSVKEAVTKVLAYNGLVKQA